MPKPRLLWVDIGMAVMPGVFIAIVIFLRDENYYLPLLFAFALLVMFWAFVAERAAVGAERKEIAHLFDSDTWRDDLLSH